MKVRNWNNKWQQKSFLIQEGRLKINFNITNLFNSVLPSGRDARRPSLFIEIYL